MSLREQLESLQINGPRWEESFEIWLSYPLAKEHLPRWRTGFAAAVMLHIAIAGFALLHQAGISAPSPGSSAQTFDIVMLPAWPKPGQRTVHLGVSANKAPTGSLLPQQRDIPVGHTSDSKVAPAAEPPPDIATALFNPPAAVPRSAPPPLADSPPSAPNAAETLWETDVLAKLAAMKRYPARALRSGEQDTVTVRFVVDRRGQLLSANIVASKGFAALDAEVLALVHRAAPLPAPPADVAGDAVQMIAPIQFILRRHL